MNNLCLDCNCKGQDFSKYQYLAEDQPEGIKRFRTLPAPGQCVDADAVYYPGGAVKIGRSGEFTIDCSSGKVEHKFDAGLLDSDGNGYHWKAGDPPPPGDAKWPGADADNDGNYDNPPTGPTTGPPPSKAPLPPLKPFTYPPCSPGGGSVDMHGP